MSKPIAYQWKKIIEDKTGINLSNGNSRRTTYTPPPRLIELMSGGKKEFTARRFWKLLRGEVWPDPSFSEIKGFCEFYKCKLPELIVFNERDAQAA